MPERACPECEAPVVHYSGSKTDLCPECKATSQARQTKAWRARNRDQIRHAHLRKTFGISLADYDKLVAAQEGKCAICAMPPTGPHGLAVDHCHDTHTIRGLLCNACNLGIGKLGDTADSVQRAVDYLTNPPAPAIVQRRPQWAIPQLAASQNQSAI